MQLSAVIVGAALLIAASLLVRYRAGIAEWQIEGRIEVIRRRGLQNEEYMQREIDSLRTPGSAQLSRLLIVVVAIFLAVAGVYAILRGLALV